MKTFCHKVTHTKWCGFAKKKLLPSASYPQIFGADDLNALVGNVNDATRLNGGLGFFVPAFPGMIYIIYICIILKHIY